MPESDDTVNFTMVCTFDVRKNVIINDMELVIKSLTDAAIQESSKAKVTVVEKNKSGNNFWIIMKTETTDFPNDPKPESDLYYICGMNKRKTH